MNPSSLPPFVGLSYSARARKPFVSEVADCGVKLPNNSVPLSIVPLPFRSSTSQASSELALVQDRCSSFRSLLRSKLTPPVASVKSKLWPPTLIRIGHGGLGTQQA